MKTLLNSINEIFKRTGIIAGDAAALTSLTDSARQRSVDLAIQVINEGIEELYSATSVPMPKEQAESTITLVTSTRSYTLATDLVQMRWPLIDKTNNQYIHEYPGGYNAILEADPEQDDTGLPRFAAIDPTDGALYLDVAPTANENGRIYTYQYDKDLALSAATDTVPFSDAVFRAMVPAWVQIWTRAMRNEFDEGLFNVSLGRAGRLLTQNQPRQNYNPR